MQYETINCEDALNCFHQLMKDDGECRVLQLSGDAKMGKSHFLAKIFPAIAQRDYSAKYAVLDLRNKAQSIVELLHTAYGLLGDISSFPTYHSTYQNWLSRSKVEVQGLQAVLSKINISSNNTADEASRILPEITRCFVNDLKLLNHQQVLLIIDSVDIATINTQTWLTDMLIVQLIKLDHVRVVIGGRTISEPSAGYAAVCRNYKLHPVQDVHAYIHYCQKINAQLTEQSIRDFAKAFDYKPGMFAEIVLSKFVQRLY